MLKKFLSYYKPHRLIFTLDMLASFTVSMVGIFYPIVTRSMVNEFTSDGRDHKIIIGGGILLLALYIIRMLLNYFIQYEGHVMGVKMQAQMRREMFDHLQKLPYSYYDNNETGKIMTRMTNDLFEVSELAHHGPENVIITSITVVASFVYLATVNWLLTLIIFLCVPFLFVIALLLRTKMRNAFKRSREATAEINAALESSISGIRVTKAFCNSETEKKKFEIGNIDFVESRRDAYRSMGQFHSSTSFITNVFNAVVLVAGGFFLFADKIAIADYSAFIVSVNLFLTPMTTLIGFMEQYQNGVTGFSRFLEIMAEEPERDTEGAHDVTDVQGHIRFSGVTCDYGTGREVLKGIDLDIEKGKTFALVGPSGGGKTTICHLIPRFYHQSSGDIFIDGINTKSMTLNSLRNSIGIVQQDVFLFNASIRENILYGRPDATEEEMIEAAKRANIHDYIMNMEKGYDTEIGERGVRLSGGQKQRLSIARVFLKNPPILILDEATSALDNTTEILIQEALDELCKGRTTIVVAHRLSTIKNADEIAVVSDGCITERGTHDQLIALGGAYEKLYSQQFRGLVK
ncbi:MAG: ABC transporter ATP-binding protein [Ruminococcaceae bacterium]|nr:ABC transporter ATP-binding protein [Oscillospiraceae bacterium]